MEAMLALADSRQDSLISLASTLGCLFKALLGGLIMGWALLTFSHLILVCTGLRQEGEVPRDWYFQPWDNFSFTSESVFHCSVNQKSFAVDQWHSEVHTKLSVLSGSNNNG